MSYQYFNRASSLGIPTWAPAMMGLGQDEPTQAIEPAPPIVEKPVIPEEPVVIPTINDPWAVMSKKEMALLSDQKLTDDLNEAIEESWRIRGCEGPYCLVQAGRNQTLRTALLAEYRRRQMAQEMPALQEPIHALAYGRYKLSKAIIGWANRSLTARVLWPVRVYMKASATALEDVIASKYLKMFIIASPVFGIWALRKMGYTGLGSVVLGGYLGMFAGAVLPIGLFSFAKALNPAEEKDFLWAVS